jgi:hypothetical protein
MYVCFKQSKPHLPDGRIDIGLRQLTAAAKLIKDLIEASS